MNIPKIIIAGVAVWLTNTVLGFLTCGKLFNWVYEIPPNVWKDPEVMMSGSNLLWINLFGLVSGLIFASAFGWLFKGIPGEGIKKGIVFGIIVWLVGPLTGIASMGFFMTIATAVLVYWIIQAFFTLIIDGIIVSLIYKEKEQKQE